MKINHVDKNGIIPHCWNSMSNLIEDRFSHGFLYSTWYVVLVEEHEKNPDLHRRTAGKGGILWKQSETIAGF